MVHPTVVEYVHTLGLRAGTPLAVSLSSRPVADEPNLGLPTSYRFSLSLSIDGKRYERQIAQVLRSPELTPYNYNHREITFISSLLTMQGIHSSNHILVPFMDVPELGLEQRMSASSILYVFSGFVEYSLALASVNGSIQAATHQFTRPLLESIHKRVRGLFEGYKIRTSTDLESLEQIRKFIC